MIYKNKLNKKLPNIPKINLKLTKYFEISNFIS